MTECTVVIGYRICDGVNIHEYERWLWEVHMPDLLANPHLDKMVYNTVLKPVNTTSGGLLHLPEGPELYRVAELHFADRTAYDRYRKWFDDHPLDPARGPSGRTDFVFYVLTETIEVTRGTWSAGASNPFARYVSQ